MMTRNDTAFAALHGQTNLPLLLTAKQAAELLGVSASTFGSWVSAGAMPGPIDGTKRWSRVQIERAAAGLPWLPPDADVQRVETKEDAYEAWERGHEEREKHRPLHNLNKRQEYALRHLLTVDTSDGTGVRGASFKTFEDLVAKGLAKRDRQGWQILTEGRREIQRMDT